MTTIQSKLLMPLFKEKSHSRIYHLHASRTSITYPLSLNRLSQHLIFTTTTTTTNNIRVEISLR